LVAVPGAIRNDLGYGNYVSILEVGPLKTTMSKMEYYCIAKSEGYPEKRKTFVLPGMFLHVAKYFSDLLSVVE